MNFDGQMREPVIEVLLLFSTGQVGGAERSLTRMALANTDAGIRYRCATIGGPGDWSMWAEEAGIDPMTYGIVGAGPHAACGAARLFRDLRNNPPAIVYVVGLRASIIVRLIRLLLPRFRVVHGIRTTFVPGWNLSKKFALVERALGRLTSGYVANSEEGADSLVRIAGVDRSMIAVVPNGMAARTARPRTCKAAQRVLVVANIHPLKGHSQFLDVVQIVQSEMPGVLFDFVGRDDMDGEIHREILRRGMSRSALFHGFQRDLNPYFSEATLSVLPSQITEGAPTSVLEAMAWGLPVVAYDVGALRQLIDDENDGYLIAPGQPEEMARRIISLLRRPDDAWAMGEKGRLKVESEFSVEKCAHLHAHLWRHLLIK